MDSKALDLAVLRKTHAQVTFCPPNSGKDSTSELVNPMPVPAFTVKAPDSALIGNLVQPFIAHNGLP